MFIYIVLTSVATGFSYIQLPSSGGSANSVGKSIFTFAHWTLIWTILFVYSIQVSTFSVLFGQFFQQRKNSNRIFSVKYTLSRWIALLAKLIGFLLWVLTFIDFYSGSAVGVRYFMCLFPNTGLLFCLQVVLQYERKSGESIQHHSSLYQRKSVIFLNFQPVW